MDKNPPGPMTPFDSLVTTPSMQLLKLILPFTPESGRRILAVSIKFAELRSALHLFSKPGCICAQSENDDSISDILDNFRPYLNEEQLNILETINIAKEMFSLFKTMESFDENNSENHNAINPMDLLTGMLSEEQQEAFRNYSSIFSEFQSVKGDDSDERLDE